MKLSVKNDQGQMVPYADFMQLEKVYGMSEITRHNLYNSAEVSALRPPATAADRPSRRWRR
jgi:HAE1 family hydrophobic/amphiphilic exporter-1